VKRRAAAAGLLLALIPSACGDDDTKSPSPKPTPTLAIASVSSAGGPTWAPGSAGCVEIGSDPGGTILVTLQIKDFSLRPPGACGGLRPCGTALLFLDGATVAESATTAISVPFGQLDAGLGSGHRTFRVELRDHVSAPVVDKELNVIADEVTLEVRAPGGCAGGADSGSDAPPDAPPDAGVDGGEDAGTDAPADAPSETGDATLDAPGPDAADAGDAAAE
jgi:hypothetical protein